jgi:RING finger and CHY zinc finger domain-containing protein 1
MCKHYNRNCKLLANCCNKVFECRICHDEYYENRKDYHILNRHKIEEIVCNICNTKQSISKKCIKCNIIFGLYFCSICNLYDNDISKKQYHCDKCMICRVGGRNNFYHCDKCNSCISINMKNNHTCINNTFHNECPICLEDIFNSIKQVTIMKCGHTIHQKCFIELVKSNIRCPLCNKSVIDTTLYNTYIENEINMTPMPEEYKYNVDILCNDCNKLSNTKFHIIGHKCEYCDSYNTVQK